MMYKVILAPVDVSPLESPALAAATRLAQRFGATLHLVRVLAPPIVGQTMPPMKAFEITEQALAEEREASRQNLEALAADVERSGGVRAEATLKEGRVTQTLRDYAVEIGADIIVMSSHSRGGLQRLSLGSVTDYLIRDTHIPVLVVKPDVPFVDENADAAPRIVVPLDGSAMAEQILPQVVTLASALNAAVTLLHVLTPQTYSQKRIIQPGLPWWDAEIAAADAYLAGRVEFLATGGVTAAKDVTLNTDVPAAILDYAIRNRANCIAVATNGLGGIRRFVFGTVADEVTRKSPISLLVFHPNLPATTDSVAGAPEVAAATGG
jgi:nucleotide-binding universal stress UspA family protein